MLKLDRASLAKHFSRVQENRPLSSVRPILFVLFFVSGFCSLLYQVIWTRMAFASFGIITPVLSVVLSVFMLGLSAGSVLGGKWISVLTKKTRLSAAFFYALAEFFIGISAFAVPLLFTFGGHFLLAAGQMNSFSYLLLSACVLTLAILPWCFFMGTTFPFMMAYIRELANPEARSFSFLYAANVLGAMCGTLLTAIVFVEIFGFRQTLHVAAAGNFCIALAGAWLGARQGWLPAITEQGQSAPANETKLPAISRSQSRLIPWVLFLTGFCAMAMEVVWTRAFTPVLKTQVYSFALIVFAYLGATFAGSLWYRHHLKKSSPWPLPKLMALLIVVVFLPVVVEDSRLVNMSWHYDWDTFSALLTLASICPFCAVLGYLTPGMVDNYAEGDPQRAGTAYAINVSGCIVGPLFASYILLPQMSERLALVLLAAPFFALYFAGWKSLTARQQIISGLTAGAVIVCSLFISHDFEYLAAHRSKRMEVRRDYAASVVSLVETDGTKSLLVNGIGMTTLTPITKFMVHLPMAFHQGTPQSALIICFGMGTSFRSALSWDMNTTAVELVPSVPKAFGFYHADATEVLQNPKGRIVIDDGRRFLERTVGKYDLVVIDPPPPVSAAGSSLLYSTEFYTLIKRHLNTNAIVEVWFPRGDRTTGQAIVRSVIDSFPHVRCFVSIEGWGLHIMASMDPIENRTLPQLIAQMPPKAKKDLMEWSSTPNIVAYMGAVTFNEVSPPDAFHISQDIQIRDDDPLNEYFLLRQSGWF